MTNVMRHLLLLVAALIPFLSVADRKNSIGRKLKPSVSLTAGMPVCAEPFDTVAADNTMVRFSGYEKTLRSNRETVFITNLLDSCEIAAVYFTITYFDSSGRLLHKSPRRHRVIVPPGETRRADLPSWDRQFTFYYAGSPAPRVSAIPYTITIRPDTLLLTK